MSESKLSPEKQVTDEEPNNHYMFTRREVLKLFGQAAGGLTLAYFTGRGLGRLLTHTLNPNGEDEKVKRKKIEFEGFMQPKVIDGIEVYGVDEKIATPKQVQNLYSYLDNNFLSAHKIEPSKAEGRIELRKELLNPNERYLEVVIRRSAYNHFLAAELDTNVSFEEWVKMHVDSMNTCFENAKPPSKMKAVLRRILVIDDDLPNSFWDEKAWLDGSGYALDAPWRYKFARPIDTDCSWAIATDYRPTIRGISQGGCFWKCRANQNGKEIIYSKSDEGEITYPNNGKESLKNSHEVWLDFGLTHEWVHYLFDLPDEYGFDFHNKNEKPKLKFNHFLLATGSFEMPWVSPYLSLLSNAHVKEKKRDCDLDGYGKGYSFKDLPSQGVTLKVLDQGGKFEECSVIIPNVEKDGQKDFDKLPDCSSPGGELSLEKSRFDSDPATILVNTSSGKSLYIPCIAFCMSNLAGLEKADYKIQFTGYDSESIDSTQMAMLCDESDIDKKITYYTKRGKKPYAYMKVAGTNAWILWFNF